MSACGGGGGPSVSTCEGLIEGDLVISEVNANALDESRGEWFEIYNAGSTERDLAGLVLSYRKLDDTGEKHHTMSSLTVPAGGYVVVGSAFSSALPPYMDYGYGKALGSFVNGGAKLALECGDTTVDEVAYQETDNGVSWSLSGGVAPDYLLNDDPMNWCDGAGEYDPGSLGTPGEANPVCMGIAPTMCDDAGTPRQVVPPTAGQLVISELMQNPDGTDADQEWFEVYVAADVDLNGLKVAKTADGTGTTIDDPSCVHATAGSYLVFARNMDMTLNGGLPRVDHVYTTILAPSGTLNLSVGGNTIDEVAWTTAADGASTALDPDSLDAIANDDASAFCPGVGSYGMGGEGTPGAPNAQCPTSILPGKCMSGSDQRDVIGLTAGQLVFTEVMANPGAVSDANGEWYEVLITSDVDLNGLAIAYDGAIKLTLDSPECLHVAAGSRLVFAASDDGVSGSDTYNGGLPLVDFLSTFGLANTSHTLAATVGGTMIDSFVYPAATDGASTQVDPDFETAEGNDDPANLCATPAGTVYGAGDRGTPNMANVQCP
jgi:hypothetical protein